MRPLPVLFSNESCDEVKRMSKFNNAASVKSSLENHPQVKQNKEGGQAFDLSPKMKLYQMVLTSFIGEPQFYRSVVNGKKTKNTDALIVETIKEVAKEDPEFVLALANMARNNFYMRSAPTLMLVESANLPEFKGGPGKKSLVKSYTPTVIRRADEITESLAYQLNRFGKKVPHSLLRGLSTTFNNFDAYQLSKYNRDRQVKMRDALRMVHPNPKNEEQSAVFKSILDDTIKPAETWENTLSNWKAKGFKSKTEAWENVIDTIFYKDGRVNNYMAILRNLRNIMESGVSDAHMNKVLSAIRNEEAVKRSKQFPFRFLSAFRVVEGLRSPYASKFMDALQDAMEISVKNVPHFEGTTFMTADESGSMGQRLSERSTLSCMDVGNLMMSIADKHCENSITSVFGTGFATLNLSTRDGILTNMQKISGVDVGWSTHAYLSIKYLLDNNIKVDRIFIFTDEEVYNSNGWGAKETVAQLLRQYKSSVNPNVFTYVFNLNGYGEAMFPEDEKNTVLISGFSEKVFDFVKAYETDRKTVFDKIDSYRIGN